MSRVVKKQHPTHEEITEGIQQLRKSLAKGGWTPISTLQKQSLKDPGVKGPVWVSRARYPPPPETDVRKVLLDAISELGDGTASFTTPQIEAVDAQWMGYKKSHSKDEPLATLSEIENYEALCKDTTNDQVIFYCYGGALLSNGPHVARGTCTSLARLTGSKCYTVRYRLAPQDPFPHALLDVLHGYLALLYPPPGSFHEPVSPRNIVFAGDSAGACLLVGLTQILLSFQRTSFRKHITFHSRSVPLPLPATLTLVSPALDWLTALPSWARNRAHDIFRGKMPAIEPCFPSCPIWPASPPREHPYAGARTLMHPLASPCTTPPDKWKGCPPVWIAVGGAEGVVDGARILARDVRATGGIVQWTEYERMPHMWAFVFKRWWQSQDIMERWASAIKRLASCEDKEKIGGEAKIMEVEGGEQSLKWTELSVPEHREILQQLASVAANMEVYDGQKEPLPKSVL